MSRTLVVTTFSLILLTMLVVTAWASLDGSVMNALVELWPHRWFQATLADAYFGFLTFFVWLAWREQSWPRSIAWFMAIMLLGNIAMSIYVLLQVRRMGGSFSMERLLLGDRQPSSEGGGSSRRD